MALILYHQLQLLPNGTSHRFTSCVSLDQTPKSCETTWFALTRLIQTQFTYNAPVPYSPSKKNKFLVGDGLAVYFQGTLHLYFFSKINTTTTPYLYTTYSTVELCIHSEKALISALLSSLSALPTLRPANSRAKIS